MDKLQNWVKRIVTALSKRDRAGAAASPGRFLIVGLGNPGPKYAHHRHNVGFQCVDHLARVHGIPLHRRRLKARLGEGHIGAHGVVLAQPLTFMNSSGEAVGPLSHWYKIPPERILVIYDDLDLPLGRLRLRPYGSSGGHNGMKSIIAALGTEDFPRLRIGIGRPQHGDPVDYVLEPFRASERPLIEAVYERVDEMVRYLLEQGIAEAMNNYNRAEMSQVGLASEEQRASQPGKRGGAQARAGRGSREMAP
ncbi:MAG: aminoacyl-tRNA hydrolase [Anaerolineae bacterium]|nr:aminoacyl-tRNA hydrolase [Anaerolineae bacterium]